MQHAFVRCRFGPRGDLHPHGRAVGAAQTQQVIRDGSFGCETTDKGGAGCGIGELGCGKGHDVLLPDVGGVSEDQFEVWVGSDRDGVAGVCV